MIKHAKSRFRDLYCELANLATSNLHVIELKLVFFLQGSHLQEEISKVILELQKDRYFEMLSSKYWNSTLRSFCPTLDDSEGITLRSLGGVFIATLVGLAIAMVVLAFEVYFHKKDAKNNVQDISNNANAGLNNESKIQVGGRILTVSSKAMQNIDNKSRFSSQFD